MPSKVTLSIVEGDDKGKDFIFEERTHCIVGRSDDCTVQIKEKEKNGKYISRHHLMLDINPPEVRVRDLGSRSGTYLCHPLKDEEGDRYELLGKRKTLHPSESQGSIEHILRDGDRLRIHNTVLKISIVIPSACHICGDEPDRIKAIGPALWICPNCEANADSDPTSDCCAVCGQSDVSIGDRIAGKSVCNQCRENPLELFKQFVNLGNKHHDSPTKSISIDGFKVIKELGRGGMGCVWLAEDIESGEYVALKVVLPERAANPVAIKGIQLEAENLSALSHENIVRLYEYGFSQGMFYFTQEFCESSSVKKLMRSSGTLRIEESIDIATQVLDGLSYAHQAPIPNVKLANGKTSTGYGLVHRDIKPGNVFLRKHKGKRIVKIGDYGLSKAFDFAGLTGRTQTGHVKGTPEFMSRKQAQCFKYSRPDVDVWAAAATLYYMLTGHVPRDFCPDQEHPVLTVLSQPPVSILRRNPKLPQRLARVIDDALDDTQDEMMFSTAASFKDALLEAT